MRFIFPILGISVLAGASAMLSAEANTAELKAKCEAGSVHACLLLDEQEQRQNAQAVVSGNLPARACVSYQGVYEATITRSGKKRGLAGVISGGDSTKQQGVIGFELNFDGSSVIGTISVEGGSTGMGVSGFSIPQMTVI